MKVKIKAPKISTQFKAERVYPGLEDLEVKPSGIEQNFKSSKYGYNNVKVKRVESEELNVTPSMEEQVNEGIFHKVLVEGDANLVPENIKQGTTIFGVEGIMEPKGKENAIIDSSLVPTMTFTVDCNIINRMITKIPNIDTSKWESTTYLFNNCKNLTEIPQLDTSNVTTMNSMFSNCDNLIKIPQLDTSNVTTMTSMCYGCSKLTKIPQLDGSSATTISSMVTSCSKLTNFGGLKNLGKSYNKETNNYNSYKLNLSSCNNLTYESLMNVINNLYDLNLSYNVANGGTLYTQTLQLGSTNLEKLTAEEIAIATSKGWTVL